VTSKWELEMVSFAPLLNVPLNTAKEDHVVVQNQPPHCRVCLLVMLLHEILGVRQTVGERDLSLCETVVFYLVGHCCHCHLFSGSLVWIRTKHQKGNHVDAIPKKDLVMKSLHLSKYCSDIAKSLPSPLNRVSSSMIFHTLDPPIHLCKCSIQVSEVSCHVVHPSAKTEDLICDIVVGGR
jgi:hypothetical protein